MKLSIITINLNNRAGLLKTIESVVSQTFTNFEYIIIDGGSTDGSVELIKEHADKITYWVSEPDKGIYNAMNKGILKATGEYLQFLNSGDWLFSNEILEHIFNATHIGDVLYGNYINVLGNNRFEEIIVPRKITLSYFYSGGIINHQSTFFKRYLFQRGHIYDETYKIISDWKYYFSLILRGAIFEHIDIFIVYFDRTNGIGAILDECHRNERIRCLNEVMPIHVRSDYDELIKLRAESEALYKSNYFKLRNQNRTYRKIITLFLLILSHIDKIFSKTWNIHP